MNLLKSQSLRAVLRKINMSRPLRNWSKQALHEWSGLALPNYTMLFTSFVHERKNKFWKCSCKNTAISIGLLPIIEYNLIQLPCLSQLPQGYSCSCKLSKSLSGFNLRQWHLFTNSTRCPVFLTLNRYNISLQADTTSYEILLVPPPNLHLKVFAAFLILGLLPQPEEGVSNTVFGDNTVPFHDTVS